jgi:hypothetical protein
VFNLLIGGKDMGAREDYMFDDLSKIKFWDDPNPDGKEMSTKNRERLEQYIKMKYDNPIVGRNKAVLAQRLGIKPQTVHQQASNFHWDYRAKLYDEVFKQSNKIDINNLCLNAVNTQIKAITNSINNYVQSQNDTAGKIEDFGGFVAATKVLAKMYNDFRFDNKDGNEDTVNNENISKETQNTLNDILESLKSLDDDSEDERTDKGV